jgi:hypothetical protein
LIALLALAAMTFGQTGRITGTVTDDSGVPVACAFVTASLGTGLPPGTPSPGGLPLFPKTPSGAKGDFEIDGLPAAPTRCVWKRGEARC